MAATMLKENTNVRTTREQIVEKFVKTLKEMPQIKQINQVTDDGLNVVIHYTCKSFLMADDLLALQRVVNPSAMTHDPIRIVGYRGDYSLTTKI